MKRSFKILLKIVIVLLVLFNIVVINHAYKFTRFYDSGTIEMIPQNQKTKSQIFSDIVFGMKAQKKKNTEMDSISSIIKTTTPDGIELESVTIKADSAKGTILMIHGHGSNKSDLYPQARAFVAMGYNVCLTDLRAHGNSGGNTSTIGFDEAIDVTTMYNLLRGEGERNIILYGVSLGAASITRAIAVDSLQPSKVILEMPFASLADAVEGRVGMMKLPKQPISTLLTFWGGTIHGFWAFSMKPEEYVKTIKCPVLLQWGANDPRVSRRETDEIFANIPTQKELVIYENSGHQNLYLNEKDKWLTNVKAFLAK